MPSGATSVRSTSLSIGLRRGGSGRRHAPRHGLQAAVGPGAPPQYTVTRTTRDAASRNGKRTWKVCLPGANGQRAA